MSSMGQSQSPSLPPGERVCALVFLGEDARPRGAQVLEETGWPLLSTPGQTMGLLITEITEGSCLTVPKGSKGHPDGGGGPPRADSESPAAGRAEDPCTPVHSL